MANFTLNLDKSQRLSLPFIIHDKLPKNQLCHYFVYQANLCQMINYAHQAN